jgi:hypothetical protein
VGILAACLLFSCRAEPAPPPPAEPAAPTESAATVDDVRTLETIPVEIRTDEGSHLFEAEVARSREEQSRGLMFRESLAADRAMIFPFPEPIMASFWMRNTLIPLDMIFVREDGRIANIEREADPLTLDSRRSTEPVIAVLEIAGGRAAELGIEPGDAVSWPGGPPFGEVHVGE